MSSNLPVPFDPSNGLSDIDEPAYRRPFKKLNPRHWQVVSLHLDGYTNNEIAAQTGYTSGYVSLIIQNPTCQDIIARCLEQVESEIKALTPLGVDAVRRGLRSLDHRASLKASDQLWKLQNRYRVKDEDGETAEDLIKQAIRIKNGDTTVEFVQEIKK